MTIKKWVLSVMLLLVVSTLYGVYSSGYNSENVVVIASNSPIIEEKVEPTSYGLMIKACSEKIGEACEFNSRHSYAYGDNGTAVLNASYYGYAKVIQIYLDTGSDVNQENIIGETPLMIAASRGYKTAVDVLIGAGGKINPLLYPKIMDLIEAVGTFDQNSLISLLNSGVDINSVNERLVTPLISAVQLGSLPIVKILIDKGARIRQIDRFGINAMEYAEFGSNSGNFGDWNAIKNYLSK